MGFLAPAFAALAAIAVPIIIMYMLRLRRREVPISSTMLWQRIMQDREANMPWQKLRRNLLLLLQLLILALLVLALMRPFLPVPSAAAGSVALVLDASASMNASDGGGGTRYERALELARTAISDLPYGEVMTIINAGPSPEVLTPATEDRAALREALGRAAPSQAATDWEAALALAGASIAGREDAAIVVISDGGLPGDLPQLPGDLRYLPVGDASSNLAVSALAVRPLNGEPQVFAAVTNYGEQAAETILGITVEGDVITAERLTVAAGETVNLTVTDLPPDTQVIEADLSDPAGMNSGDVLPLDDHAVAVYTPPASGEVLLVTEGNLFLEELFVAIPTLTVYRAAVDDIPDREFDLVVFDGVLPDELPQTNLLLLNPPGSTGLFSVGETFTDTRVVRQVDDGLLAFVDFSTIAIREARSIQAAGWAASLVQAEGGPLLLAGTQAGRRVAIIPFDLRASDLPLRIEYPILFSNLLEWYAPSSVLDASGGLKPGEVVVIRPRALTTQYRVTLPDGTVARFPADGEPLTFVDTVQTGLYRVELLEGLEVQQEAAFAVNLFAPGESHVAPRAAILIGGAEIGEIGAEDRLGQREIWWIAGGLALLVLLIEWWVFHRGAVIPRREQDRREPGGPLTTGRS